MDIWFKVTIMYLIIVFQGPTQTLGYSVGPQGMLWHYHICPEITRFHASLEVCKERCSRHYTCTAFNYVPTGPSRCELLTCPLPIPEPTWNYGRGWRGYSRVTHTESYSVGPQGMLWHYHICPEITRFHASLEVCKDRCSRHDICTAFNYVPTGTSRCELLTCPLPIPEPTWHYGRGWRGYSRVIEIGVSHKEIAVHYAPKLRFDSKFGTTNKCFPSNAETYYNYRKLGNKHRICNTDYNTIRFGDIPTYWKATECGNHLHIAYWFFSGYQDTCFASHGSHDVDWEHIYVKVYDYKTKSQRLGPVQFYQHGGWYTKNPGHYSVYGTHPIVYSGKNHHGSYHDDGGSGGCCYWEDFRNPGRHDRHMKTWLNLEELRRTDSAPPFMQDKNSKDKFNGYDSPLDRPETDNMCKLPGCKGGKTKDCATTNGCYKSQISDNEHF